MAIQFERYSYHRNDGGDFRQLQERQENLDGGGGGVVGGFVIRDNTAATPPGYFDAQIVGIPAAIPQAVVESASVLSDTIVITDQVLVEGFGSYLSDILPNDIAITAGAFGATMQQIRNIMQVPIEKFAQVVASIETTQGLDLVNGTNVPTDVSEAQAAYNLVALGTGPYKTFTYSDFFGCMSGLPYDWQALQNGIFDLQTDNLTNIYQNLYNAIIAGPQPYDPITNPDPITAYNASVQAQIDLANTEIALIRTVRPGASMDLNDVYDKFGTQLGNEQRARNKGLSPLPDPFDPATRDPYINKYSIVEYSFADSLPLYGVQTQPHMAAQTLEAISDLTFVAGQSVIAAMREARNKDRLNFIGISQDNNIPDIIEEQKEWITNTIVTTDIILPDGNVIPEQTLVGNAVPAYPYNTVPLGYYNPINQTYNAYNVPSVVTTPESLPTPGLSPTPVPPTFAPPSVGTAASLVPGRPATPVDTGGPKVPGSLAKSPYQNLIPPQLSTLFTSDVLLPAQYNVPDAIEQVIDCNCDCWLQ